MPEGRDRTADLIIKTEDHITRGRAAFAVDHRTEAITALYSECRVEALNVPAINILREGKQTRARVSGSRFEFGISHF